MNKVTILFLSAAVLAGGCVAPPTALQPSPTGLPSRATATAIPPAVGAAGPATLPGPIVVRSSSLSLVVDDPVGAMGELERVIEDAGGFVSSASSWSSADGGYSNLSARVPLDSMGDVRIAARSMALQVQSDSAYSQDVTFEYGNLVEQLRQLQQAEAEVESMLSVANDPQRVSSLQLVLELVQREKQNIESQVTSYNDRATLGTLDINLTSTVPTPYLFGPTPTPAPYLPGGIATATPSAVY